jgi:hypothetical protein
MNLHKAAFAGTVWLTAIITLIAGVPVSRCFCADGGEKSLLTPVSLPANSCCQCGTCSEEDDQPPLPTPTDDNHACCQHQTHAASGPSRDSGQFRSKSCVKSVAVMAPSTIPQEQKPDRPSLTAVWIAVPQFTLALSVTANRPVAYFEVHLLPPPTDLVIALQHLVI